MLMPELFVSAFKVVASPAIKFAGYLVNRFRRPTVRFPRAPKNLLEHIHPGVSVAKMRELLGAPRHEEPGVFRYVFAEACVQLDAKDSRTIDAVSIALCSVAPRNRFAVWPMTHIVLGQTTFKEILRPEDVPKHSSSSKHSHTYVEQYHGFPGAYYTYGFGILECPRVWPGREFWWPDRPRSEIPDRMRINWVCVSGPSELPKFMYLGFL